MNKVSFYCFLAASIALYTAGVDGFVRSAVTQSGAFTSQESLTKGFMTDDFIQETQEATQNRIKEMVDENTVLLFMKGSKIFPQCGFSNTAVQILQSYDIDFETVDVLSDEAIRQGVKEFSQWPTIPQLYLDGEFIGG